MMPTELSGMHRMRATRDRIEPQTRGAGIVSPGRMGPPASWFRLGWRPDVHGVAAWVMVVAVAGLAGCVDAPSEDDAAPPNVEGTTVGWNETLVRGTVSGPNVVAFSANPQFHWFDVVDATTLKLELAAAGGDVYAYFFAPSCDAIECGIRVSAQAGSTGTWTGDDPEPGEWEVHVAKGDPGVGEVGYTLRILQQRDVAPPDAGA